MAKSKSTITRDSVFRNTGNTPKPIIKQGITPADENNLQTAMWLSASDVSWIDTQVQKVREGGWRSVTRSAIFRALIRSAKNNGVDLSGVTGEAEIEQRISSKK
jgi:hypothetical protein